VPARKRSLATCGTLGRRSRRTADLTACIKTSMGLKNIILSARITGMVMNYPLYDGEVSAAARELIAQGRLDAAIAEYRRLADLGSGRARCVLAYLHLRDLPGRPRDVDIAKKLATSALTSEPGYANYVLATSAMIEGDSSHCAPIMAESCKARFPPAFAAMAQIFNQGYGVKRDPKYAETLFLRAIEFKYIPAEFMICKLYSTGDLGPIKHLFGRIALPFAWVRLWFLTRFMIFSVRTFRHFNVIKPPMFNEGALKS
jgi:hypothetical protein